ncbi:hypothetical protein BD324DRAFT_640075 [Kockovaella imperatae]|uniref:Uncharacterized protein n=1 Tax=Kockovaella imperatae TaxID=4999 RepID=A0A1Y1U744_9TREE|nr:hypothetical protein BD324DRAFT_640075 [Kockovaella imperatae]ORX33346.1 hypothetical protein BD324DRAFT_640075 [Kockovaella imperatae]
MTPAQSAILKLLADYEQAIGPYDIKDSNSLVAFSAYCQGVAASTHTSNRRPLGEVSVNQSGHTTNEFFCSTPKRSRTNRRKADTVDHNQRQRGYREEQQSDTALLFDFNELAEELASATEDSDEHSEAVVRVRREIEVLHEDFVERGRRLKGPGLRYHLGAAFFLNLPFEYLDHILNRLEPDGGSKKELSSKEVAKLKYYLGKASLFPAKTPDIVEWQKTHQYLFVQKVRE